ncbi:tumor necrosis factor ligand superfamily member 13B isoform 2 [Mus musculus]|uniref:Isoform 2 of Tumor necrosis factor ligand superfamily member 13B n=1 Tax=Mus musculus TaxID=10090 RepID=Q9WU72-2|nr:tumor necrosis factor ligand superfamily member 13B isoform 2 [Mus musculus]AAI06841.1 Tnfsf13b protein [Mus musculus]AAP82036.1 delta BAFF [Mus musculus]EDL22044.1 tumor necrosis factor (ligand) superfamily, member 13b, isoform CRA_b [Mus musculus]|eukprot:XP_006508837.1 PREDICTED: tumor necrosis factor ligand superfamily member 13B isoform X1 [Mus musculus]
MDESAKTLPPPCLCFCSEKGEDMKVGYDPITPQKEEGAWFGICRDGRLLAATLLLALLSSSFTAMSLYQLAALQADLMNLRMELQSYRGSATPAAAGAPELTAGVKLLTPAAPRPHNSSRGHRNRRAFQGPEETEQDVDLSAPPAPCLPGCRHSQHDDNGMNLRNRTYTFVPWLLSFKRGNALEEKENKIVVRQTGYFFIYSQVLYTDPIFAMGHVIQRKKVHVFGDELSLVTLFRCIQNMPKTLPNNSCYSAGIARLEEGDEIQLAIPRENAQISRNGDDTFFGALKLL